MSAFTRLDHVGIVCANLDETVRFYRSTFGFELCHTEVNDEQGHREAMLRVNGTDDGGHTYLQLLTPTRPDSVVGRWLATRGEGVHHVAFGTADVSGAVTVLAAQGLAVLFDPPRRGAMDSLVTFLHPKDCHGVLTELVSAKSTTP